MQSLKDTRNTLLHDIRLYSNIFSFSPMFVVWKENHSFKPLKVIVFLKSAVKCDWLSKISQKCTNVFFHKKTLVSTKLVKEKFAVKCVSMISVSCRWLRQLKCEVSCEKRETAEFEKLLKFNKDFFGKNFLIPFRRHLQLSWWVVNLVVVIGHTVTENWNFYTLWSKILEKDCWLNLSICLQNVSSRRKDLCHCFNTLCELTEKMVLHLLIFLYVLNFGTNTALVLLFSLKCLYTFTQTL